MTAANEQIIESYESLGLTPEQIAEEQELDTAAVKAVLMQFSTAYRKACNSESSEESKFNFTDFEAERARSTIAELSAYSEDENLRFRAAKYVLDDKKGRLDAPKAMAGLNINVLQLNEHMTKALRAINKSKTIDVQVTDSSPNKVLTNG